MKKFFVILTALVMLLAFSIPLFSVHAAESDYIGTITFNDTIDLESLLAIPLSDRQFSFEAFNSDKGEYQEFKGIHVTSGALSYLSLTNSQVSTNYFGKTIYLLSEPSESLSEWLVDNSTYSGPPVCDGTSCYWADDDYNGICDTCGFSLMSFRYDLLDYAYEVLNQSFNDHIYWFIEKETAYPSGEVSYNLYKSRTPFVYDNGRLYSESNYLHAIVMFDSNDVPTTIWWVTVDGGTNIPVDVSDTVVDSSHDIDGFFPLPLHQMMGVVVSQEMTIMIQKTLRVMMALMISGVVCLAFLIVLNLFGKRSLIYPKQ